MICDSPAWNSTMSETPASSRNCGAAIREPRGLVWVDADVLSVRGAVRDQTFTHEQRRDAVPESDFDRSRRTLVGYPLPQRFAFGRARGHRKQAMHASVRSRDGFALTNETVDHATHLP